MRWVETKKAIGNNGVSETTHLELFMDFPHSRWNEKDHSPVAFLTYYERTDIIYKTCIVKFTFPRLPQMYFCKTEHKMWDEIVMDIEVCKKSVEEYLKGYLINILNQLLDDSEKVSILPNKEGTLLKSYI
jgi:hypothetical protein